MSLHKQAAGGEKRVLLLLLLSSREGALLGHHDPVCPPLQQAGEAEASEVVRCLPGEIFQRFHKCQLLILGSCLMSIYALIAKEVHFILSRSNTFRTLISG